MKLIFLHCAMFMAASASFLCCKSIAIQRDKHVPPSLKRSFGQDFLIGAAIDVPQIEQRNPSVDSLITQQFNAVTPGNVMKADAVHPSWGKYNFAMADRLIDFAQHKNIKINAHNLIWHSQLPPFMRHIQNADSVRQYFVDHITTVAGRYDGKVYSWDVVNEALNEDGSLRNTIFLQKLGPDYVVDAFKLAQHASPHSKLYYNDYNIEQPKKRAGVIELVKRIQAARVRIDGIGIQGHWKSGAVPLKEIEESIKAFSALGVEVMITELDLSVLPNPWKNDNADIGNTSSGGADMNPYVNGLPEIEQQKLAESYTALFQLFIQYKKSISRVTFWGVYDGQSWLNDWPIRGRTNYPLLFDRQLMAKPAFFEVIKVAKADKSSQEK